jgi:fido (protein-threonine AMPylation protein)
MSGQEGAAPPRAAPFSRPQCQQELDIAQLEVDNGLLQIDLGIDVIKTFLEPDRPFALRPTLIQQLQKVAVDGIVPYPGEWRTAPAKITKSKHVSPDAHLVGFLVQEMCDYVNDNWHEKTAFHLAAYVMWKLNWIHPFADGNGRTSRVSSYIVLCTSLNTLLPGSPTILEQIQDDRTTYFRALEHADAAAVAGQVNVSEMELALRNMLAKQLLSVIEQASGGNIRSR